MTADATSGPSTCATIAWRGSRMNCRWDRPNIAMNNAAVEKEKK
jgi:hypothetical protein